MAQRAEQPDVPATVRELIPRLLAQLTERTHLDYREVRELRAVHTLAQHVPALIF